MPHLLAPNHAAIRRFVSVPLLLVLFLTAAPAQDTGDLPAGVLRPFDSDQEAADYLYGRLLERDSLRRARIARCEGNMEVRVYRTASGPFGADSADAPSILHGRVTWEETGEPLPGATAVELNSLRGSAADLDGRFRFDVPAERIRSNCVITVHATDIGFIEAKTSIVLKPGESAEIQVRLCLDDDVNVDYVSSPTIPSTTPQHESVDDGGLLKRIGDHLVILRRGKLYTVYVGGGRLEVVDVTPTFGQTIDLDDIYGVRLYSGASGALVGYGEHRGCARVGIHAPDDRGRRRVHRVHAVPNATYSIWEDPAAHLVDGRLVLFSSHFLHLDETQPRGLWSLAPSLRPGKGTADHDAHAAEDCGDAWSDLRDDLCENDCDDDQRIPTAVTSTRFFRPARCRIPAICRCRFTGPVH